ncbi:BTAD domain-containing putative transcriptional regulator [Pseudonocardia broussonetiae]|uniref:AfsR/SARP family transcriptional regulator n=1 Tax=Pseudonocardia broussonetiae TaxID=2736640 RepID=A0A6M6JDQ4_9PSEU|nr:BTAD domain-containing putative transcriptional regulator [Pseudonocardia broussonetiae]QJY45067.1 AfsR/SARP family transcriptional regulator [Pseudonocardia broussonetiae]
MRIGLLGAVEAWPDAPGTAVPLPGLRVRGLLARLALDAGRPVGTAALVDDLWGEQPPDAAGNALQALVSRLRRAVGADLVGTEPGGYRLRIAPDAVDALRFDALAADPARLTEALALWRGPALADVRDLPFAAAAADRLDERRAAAVERRAALALGSGGPADLDALTAQLAAAPLRETTAALLARALHATGRQADALAVVDRTAARLADELGIDPGAELAAARMEVLRQAPARPRAAPPAGAPVSSFVGRDDDVRRVRTLLGTHRLVTLTGPGGAGKTRLSREAVDGEPHVRVAELAPLTGPEQLPATLLAAVGGPELQLRASDEAAAAVPDRLVAALTGRDTLLVLDNCEHLVHAAAALVDLLLPRCPALRVLATSREPLGVPGEVLHPVDALRGADAVRLFVDRAAAVRPGFALTPQVEPVVAEICRRLDGQPLPIELAAARIRTLSPAEIAERLADRFRLLTTGPRTAQPRHQTLRAVVDWSWDLLAEPERAVARRLGAFAGGATAATAERVCSGPDVPDVFDALASLVDKSLVVAVPQAEGPTRYRMLETIRVYAVERLDEAGERERAEAAHLAVVLELVEEAEPRLRGPGQLDRLARLRAEAEEIDVALRRTVAAGDSAAAHRLAAAMGWSWMIRGLLEEARRWFEAVHVLDGPAPAAARALVTGYLGISCVGGVESERGTALLADAIAIVDTLPEPRHPLLDLLGPGTDVFSGRGDDAIRRLSHEATDPWLRAFALQVRAVAAENDGRIDDQRRLLRAARALHASTGDRFGLGMAVHSLGELEEVAGDPVAAAAAYDEAIVLAEELGNDDRIDFLSRRAVLHASQGDRAAACATLRRAEDASDGSAPSRWTIAVSRAGIERLTGDVDAARAAVAVASAGLRQLEDEAGLAVAQRKAWVGALRAEIELTAGDPDAAQGPLADAVAAALEARDGPVSGMVAEVAARLLLAHGDAEGAALLLGVAHTQRGALDLGSADVLASLAQVDDVLGPAAAQEAQRRGRELPRDDGLAELERAVAAVGGTYVRRR